MVQKNLKIALVFKYNLIIALIQPIIALIFPMIIMGAFFNYNAEFGVWNQDNFLVYQFIAFQIGLISGILGRFSGSLRADKSQYALHYIMIAPLTRVNLLIGIFITHFILISIPFIVTFIICYIYFPILIFTIFLIFLLYFMLTLIWGSIGIVLGVYAIAKYHYVKPINFTISLFFMFSCVTYPFEIFPKVIQDVDRTKREGGPLS